VVIKLQKPDDYRPQDGARFEVHFDKARSLFGEDVAPFEAKLSTSDDGRHHWTVSEDGSNAELLAMHAQGMSYQQIGERLGCDKSTVMRRLDKIKKAA